MEEMSRKLGYLEVQLLAKLVTSEVLVFELVVKSSSGS